MIGGAKTTATSRVADHVARPTVSAKADMTDMVQSKLTGSATTSTGRVSRHVKSPAGRNAAGKLTGGGR